MLIPRECGLVHANAMNSATPQINGKGIDHNYPSIREKQIAKFEWPFRPLILVIGHSFPPTTLTNNYLVRNNKIKVTECCHDFYGFSIGESAAIPIVECFNVVINIVTRTHC